MDATIHVFTFKDGLLSKLAHDLQLSLTRFEINARGTEITARFEVGSMKVLGVMRNGQLERGVLSPADKEKIRETMRKDVMRVSDYPEIRFKGATSNKQAPFLLEGTLEMFGNVRHVRVVLNTRNKRLLGEVELTPSQWGIKPYRALGGALKLQDRVVVAIDASAEWLEAGSGLNPAIQLSWTGRSTSYPPGRVGL